MQYYEEESWGSNTYIWSKLISTSEVTLNAWHFFYFLRSGRDYRFFVDGIEYTDKDLPENQIGSDSIYCDWTREDDRGIRFGLGKARWHTEDDDDVIPSLSFYIKRFALFMGAVPYTKSFAAPNVGQDWLSDWVNAGLARYKIKGHADQIVFGYRFQKGLYDGNDSWHQIFTESIQSDQTGGLIVTWRPYMREGYGSTDVKGKWLGVYSFGKWFSFDYVPLSGTGYSGTFFPGETITTSSGGGSAILVGMSESYPYTRFYLDKIVNPSAFVAGRVVTGSKSNAHATLSGSLVTKESNTGIEVSTRARLPMRGSSVDKVNEANLYSITAIRRLNLRYPYIAQIGVEIPAQDRLVNVPTVNVIVRRGQLGIRVWNGRAYFYEYHNSDNPAWVCYDILTNERYGAGYDPKRLDYASFSEWASYCDVPVYDPPEMIEISKRITCNGVFDVKDMSVQDALEQILQVGRARLSSFGSVLYAKVNKPSDPVAMVSSSMYEKNSMVVEWVTDKDKPSILRIEFLDAKNQYKKNVAEAVCDEIISDPVEMREAKIETIFIPWITSYGQALREADLRLRTVRSIQKKYAWQMDIDGLAFEIGDVIILQSESNKYGFGGKIESVNATAHTVKLDRKIQLDSAMYSSSNAKVAVRSNDTDQYYLLQIDSPFDSLTDTFTVSAPANLNQILSDISKGDPFAIGRYEYDLELVRIESITLTNEMKVKIEAVNYDPSVFTEQEA